MSGPSREQVETVLRLTLEARNERLPAAAEMIAGVTIDDDARVTAALNVPADQATALEPVRAAVEGALAAMPDVEKATVILTSERPMAGGPPGAGATAARPTGQQTPPRPLGGGRSRGGRRIEVPNVKSIVAVASGKGGVGKSTMAINLALGLAATGLSA